MALDTGSVIVTVLLVASVVALFSWSLALGPKAPVWRVHWAAGNTSLLLGTMLLLTQGKWSAWVSIILANGLILLGYGLIEEGLRRFARRPAPRWLHWVNVLGFLVPFVLFTFVWPSYLARVVVNTAIIVTIWWRIGDILRTGIRPERQHHPGFIGGLLVLCLVIVVFNTLRMVFAFIEPSSAVLAQSNALVALFLMSAVAMVAWTLGFVTLDILRNQWQLETALETRDKMMALIAHDLKGPMGGQMGLVDVMRTERLYQDDPEHLVDLLAMSSRGSYTLLENLLDWAQSQKGSIELHPEALDAAELLADAAQPFSTAAHIKNIAVSIQAEKGQSLTGDRKTLTTILRNLISNALKFTPRGGEVRLSFQMAGDQLEFRVEDTGPGVPSDIVTKLGATPSSLGTEGEPGSGLGLALCREFARLNGGELRFGSPSKGASVALVLPQRS